MYNPKEEYEVIECPSRFRLTVEDVDTDIRIHLLNQMGFKDYKLFFVDVYGFDELRSKLALVEDGMPFIGLDIKLIHEQIAEDGLEGAEAEKEMENLLKREIANGLARGYCELHGIENEYVTDDVFESFVDSWVNLNKIDIGILQLKITEEA